MCCGKLFMKPRFLFTDNQSKQKNGGNFIKDIFENTKKVFFGNIELFFLLFLLINRAMKSSLLIKISGLIIISIKSKCLWINEANNPIKDDNSLDDNSLAGIFQRLNICRYFKYVTIYCYKKFPNSTFD